MVATPGDPRNGVRVTELDEAVKIDTAYGGSCTGGKMADMDMYAAVLSRAVEQGRRVAPGVHLYLQFGSQKIKEYARARGYIEIFERAGAELIDPRAARASTPGRAPRSRRAGHGQRAEPQLPRPQRPRQGLSRVPLRRRGLGHRGPHRRAGRIPERAEAELVEV